MNIDTSDVPAHVLEAPATKGELAQVMALYRLHSLYTDNAILAAFQQDRDKLLEYLNKIDEHYKLIDEAHDRLLGRKK